MAKLTTYYNLTHIDDPKEFLGLAPDKEGGNIITTLGRNIILILKISTQKQIRSWTVLDKLSSKVVYDKVSNRYVGVFMNKYLRCWDLDDNNLNKIKKIKFRKRIADLVYNKQGETIVVFEDGAYANLSEAILTRKQDVQDVANTIDPERHDIIEAGVFASRRGSLLSIFTRDKKTNSVQLTLSQLNEHGSKTKLSLSRSEQNVNLVGFTIVEGEENPSVCTLWSDQRIFLLKLDDFLTPSDSPGNFISMLTVLNCNTPLSVRGISRDCVAIYGGNSGQEGSSLILYNTQFKAIKAKQFFKVYFDFSNIWSIEQSILLVIGQNLSVISFHLSKELLCDMLGTKMSNSLTEYVGSRFINEEEELEKCLDLEMLARTDMEYKQGEAMEVYGKSLKLPNLSYEFFENSLRLLCQNDLHVKLTKDCNRNTGHIDVKSDINVSQFRENDIELLATELEMAGACEEEISEKLIRLTLKAGLIDEAVRCIQRYSNIPEKDLVNVLKTLLENYSDHMNEISRISHISNINKVLSYSFNNDKIMHYLRNEVNFDIALKLIKHLYDLVSDNDKELNEVNESSFHFDDEMQILQWVIACIDSHFQNILVSSDPGVLEIISKWQRKLNQWLSCSYRLRELYSTLYSVINSKYICSEKNCCKWYSIQEVTF